MNTKEITLNLYKKGEYIMTKRVIEHKIKLEKSVKIILGVLAFGVFLNPFAPVFDVREAFSVREAFAQRTIGSKSNPVRVAVCKWSSFNSPKCQ